MVEKMDEPLAALLVAPFFVVLVGFAVAIAFAPAVPNEIALATERDHEEMDDARCSHDEPGVEFRKKAKWK